MTKEQKARAYNIFKQIQALGLKNSHVAKQCGINQGTLSLIINGNQTFVSDKLLDKIEKYLQEVKT